MPFELDSSQVTSSPRALWTLATSIPGLTLRELTPVHAAAWVEVANRNRDHLTEFGEDTLPPDTAEGVIAWLSGPRGLDVRMGIWRQGELVGFVSASHLSLAMGGEDLLASSPDGFAIGYWVASEHVGEGYATAACRSLMEGVQSELGGTVFWATTRAGNVASVAVLERLGFEPFESRPSGMRYRLEP